MRSLLTACVLTLVIAASALAAPLRICFGDSSHPVVYGEAWLVADGWGWNPAVLVATIHDGRLEPRHDLQFPADFSQQAEYRLIVGAGVTAVPPLTSETGSGLGVLSESHVPDYLQHFSAIYVSSAMAHFQQASNWQLTLQSLGRTDAASLVFPPPRRRTIRLLYPDGRPLPNATVPVGLFCSNSNHCGAAVGIPLGNITTDHDGRASIIATSGPLGIARRCWIPHADGPAGAAYELDDYLIGGAGNDVTFTALWNLPEYDYLVTFRTPAGKSLPGIHLNGCLWSFPCGAGCGPVPRYQPPVSDSSGQLRFREQDLRTLGKITAVDPAGSERPLTTAELKALFTTHRVTVIWE